MSELSGKVALVTGATGGIGAAISLALANEGMRLFLTGRDNGRLEDLSLRTLKHALSVEVHRADLEDDAQLRAMAAHAEELFGGVDVLVHAIGLFRGGDLEHAPVEDLDRQYRVNVRVPYLLTQTLLPSLTARQGQVVFVNSSAGHHPGRAGFGGYAATKHGLSALADSLREEVNRRGVRVLTVFPGRTATSMQAEVHRFEGKTYEPERFLQPDDVASAVVHALSLPRTAELTDLHLRPMRP
ncbi:MAG TPA: SDR family NAD(P)-dependent oxidoreductase [Thermoanaerobaculia bacterium]|nr:SDR family NAD(P)-dependent oxidoreductase [Thermoanaerobaculia bacterium]